MRHSIQTVAKDHRLHSPLSFPQCCVGCINDSDAAWALRRLELAAT